MSAPFTPGPWHYRGDISLSVESEFLARTICRLRPGLKTRGEIESATKSGDNLEADARLISAAPDLYAFAEASPCHCEDGDDQFCRRCAVLQKARGEA